ncbi:MAG: helicase protein, partial [uncultured bacterium]
MTADRVFAIKTEMEKAEARKLQPFFIKSFFNKAFEHFKGSLRQREPGRFEITHVPAIVRDRDRQITGRDRRNLSPVLKRYERVCFEKQYVRLIDRVNTPMASLIHPGHPLVQSLVDLVLEEHRTKLKQGTVLVNAQDMGVEPRVLFLLDHAVRESGENGRSASRRIQFVEINERGEAINAGYAPHLDYEALPVSDYSLVQDILQSHWMTDDLERVALAYASQHIVPEHYKEVKERRERQADKTLA